MANTAELQTKIEELSSRITNLNLGIQSYLAELRKISQELGQPLMS